MRAMILAAGRGERMRPLTDATPKPLLTVGGKPLIEYHLERLARAGIHEVVINHGRLGHLIEASLGTGERFGVRLVYSPEGNTPLETGGGIFQALPLLGAEPFYAINADIWTDFECHEPVLTGQDVAHLVLVPNPEHNPAGDFVLEDGRIGNGEAQRYTFSGIGIYHPVLFRECRPGRFPLAPLLRSAAEEGRVSGRLHTGVWHDIGTPERLEALRHQYSQ